jgi:hypothetical protein
MGAHVLVLDQQGYAYLSQQRGWKMGRRSVTLILAALLLLGCSPTGGGNAGSLGGTGVVPFQIQASGDVLKVDVAVHLSRGTARLELVSPTGTREPAATVEGSKEFHTQVQERNARGTWTAVWTLADAEGSYEIRWND